MKKREDFLLTKIRVFVSSLQSRRRVLFFDPQSRNLKNAATATTRPNRRHGQTRKGVATDRGCARGEPERYRLMANFGCVKPRNAHDTAKGPWAEDKKVSGAGERRFALKSRMRWRLYRWLDCLRFVDRLVVSNCMVAIDVIWCMINMREDERAHG